MHAFIHSFNSTTLPPTHAPQVTDPYLKLFSGLVPPLLGSIDLTPLLGFFILQAGSHPPCGFFGRVGGAFTGGQLGQADRQAEPRRWQSVSRMDGDIQSVGPHLLLRVTSAPWLAPLDCSCCRVLACPAAMSCILPTSPHTHAAGLPCPALQFLAGALDVADDESKYW